jgi:SAM-dependent methyltransferase
MSDPLDVVSAFDATAAGYDRAYDAPGLRNDWLRSRLAAALELIGDGPGAVLDAGMGPGRLLEELERRGWTGWGIDAAPNMVALARARVPAARERIGEGRLEALPFADGTFDAVVAAGVINYTRDPAAIVRELARVLRPGGRAVIALGNARSPCRLWRERVVYPTVWTIKHRHPAGRPAPLWRNRAFSRRRARRLLGAAGLEPEASRVAAFTLLPDPLDSLFPDAAAWLGNFAARRGPFVRSLAAMQLLVAARKVTPRP